MKSHKTSFIFAVVASFALMLVLVANAFCAPQKRQPVQTGKQVGELCVRLNKAQTLAQARPFVTGGCMVINPGNTAGRDKCIKQAIARVKQLKPGIR